MKISSKLPLIGKSKKLERYATYLEQTGIRVDPLVWLIFSAAIGIGIAYGILTINASAAVVAGIMFIVVVDLLLGFPYLQAMKRVEAIENDLPNALKQMAETLKAGGTYEYALREVAVSAYGPLKREIEGILRNLEEGENFDNSLELFASNVNSRLVKRTVTIIVDSIKSGASLAEILDDIAEDVRTMHRLNRERKTRTLMQALFIVVAAAVIAPLIFGFVSTIIAVLIEASAGSVAEEAKKKALEAASTIAGLIEIYIIMEVIATSIMLSLMREGNAKKSIIYFPAILFIAYLSYVASKAIAAGMFRV